MSRMDGKATEGRGTFRRFAAPLAVCIAVATGACSSDSSDASGASATTAKSTTTLPESTSSTAPPEQPPTSAPDGGTVDELETDTAPGRVLDPIPLSQTADLGNGVTATVTATEAIDATAQQPGETGGPAVLVTVAVTNGSGAEIDLDYVAIDLTTATGVPLSRVLVDPAGPFRGPLAPGATASGKYAFTIPAADRDQVTLTFKYSADTPMAVFTGDLPR